MRHTLFGVGAISLIVLAAVSAALILVIRYRAGQRLMRQQAEANAALLEAANAAKEANRAKTVFLSHMSHDIRTPINGIMGMADIATRNMSDSGQIADCLGKITESSRHLLSLVNDVLDMSRIESGNIHLEEKPFYISAMLNGCCSVVAGQMLEKKISFRRDFSNIQQEILLGDELHLRQILINILGNAVKFTPECGEIEFRVNDELLKDGTDKITFRIRDNGIGMSREFQDKIFEPFVQEDNVSRSSYKGTGLGMSIVKQIVDLMGGTVAVESEQGKGSIFTVSLTLPCADMPENEERDGCTGEELSGMRILLVEDNELNMEIARYILDDCRAEVTEALNGKEAVEQFLKMPERSFDAILMDVMMPVMGGLEAAKAIRSSKRKDAESIPIVAMTANAYAEDRQAAYDAGMNYYLPKPVEREELIYLLCQIV